MNLPIPMDNGPTSSRGLTSSEAALRLEQRGPNAIPQAKPHPIRAFLKRLWGPVPWMLELAVILELILKKYDEAAIVAVLILFNAVFSAIQEKRSSDALAKLGQRFKLIARVRRDGTWQTLPSEVLVPDDVIHIRMGDLLPADVKLLEGDLLLDQSALTGESLPVEVTAGADGYAGAVVRHGEATALVTATGVHTRFGRTAELVRGAKSQSNLETVVFSVTRTLVILDASLALAVIAYALLVHLPILEILPFALILLVASVPVALPATFTIATALGAQELSHQGVLVTNLSAIEEAAGMDVLCTDKTGTITENRLSVAHLLLYAASDENELLRLAAMACDPSTQDPLDLAILQKAQERGTLPDFDEREQFLPFEPATRRSEAIFRVDGRHLRVAKGAPHAIAGLCESIPDHFEIDTDHLAEQGYRVLAVMRGDGQAPQLAGLVSLQDKPRTNSPELIRQLKKMGLRVIMVTGDGLPTAQAVARQVGISDQDCEAQASTANTTPDITRNVFAEVLPEHKFGLVQALQEAGHITGMTGDGVNDAPALKQAQVGIAVSNATDVAKAAASMVLTSPGLENIVAIIQVSRRIYQRMLSYTLNKIVKTIQIAAFLSLGLIFTGNFVTTPLLVVLLLFANDFVTISIATDRVRPSRGPDRWDVESLIIPALGLAIPVLVLTFGIFLAGRDLLHLRTAQLQTLSFTTLVFTGQGMIYLVRERHHFWSSRPGKWLSFASVLDVMVVVLLATVGVLMQAIPIWVVLANLAVVVVFLIGLDYLKVWLFQKYHLH